MNLFALVSAAAVTVAAAGGPAAHAPVMQTGDHVTLQYTYVGHVSSSDKTTDISARMTILATAPSAATVTIDYAGRTRDVPAVLHADGTLSTSGATKSDLLPQYNAIPMVLGSAKSGAGGTSAAWAASIPVKISETEWQNVPVRITSSARDGHTDLDAAGKKSFLVFTHGFTVSEDVTVKGRAEFDRGLFKTAHFDVHSVVHALKDIPLSYEWTMSPQT